MRHFWSFLAGLAAAPLSWVLIALGQDGSASTIARWADAGTYNVANLIEPAVYLAVAGIVLGLLGTLRFSPLGPLVAGLLLVAPYVGMFINPFGVRNQVPASWKVLGDPLPLRLPLDNGTLFMIGLLLVMATFSGQRWRRWPESTSSGEAALVGVDGPKTRSAEDQPAERTIDWSVLREPEKEPDTAPLSLGYPDPQPTGGAGRRDGGTPWSDPPSSWRDNATR
ncbi:hypothetical protein [Plantactinospora sp. GCM10030261]|uniref:hypothetical protein n=1 Tax=Plantactinospora sp. GCM10030261 TaxID=3273420 RepID=UPI003609321D